MTTQIKLQTKSKTVRPIASGALAQIEAAQLIVQAAGIANMNVGGSGRQRLGYAECGRLGPRIEGHRGFLRADRDLVEIDVDRVQYDRARRRGHAHANRFGPFESRMREHGLDPEFYLGEESWSVADENPLVD